MTEAPIWGLALSLSHSNTGQLQCHELPYGDIQVAKN